MSLLSGNERKIFAKGVIGNVRKAQEDSHGYKLGTPNGDLFVVCDGMGGHVGGAMASRIAVDSIIEYIDKETYTTPIEALDGALKFANMQILGYASAHSEYKGMGTTACIVLMHGEGVWIAHVGDSRIYLYLGKEKQLHRITKDHSYVQTLVDAGQITDEEAEHHPNKNRIMKALGIKPELQPTFNNAKVPILPKNGDIFLICSDGLCGMIPDRTIERVLGEKMTLQQKGEKLIELAMQGETVQPGGQDNCTVELIEVDNSIGKRSIFKSYNPKGRSVMKGRTNLGKRILKILIPIVVVLLVLGGIIQFISPKLYQVRQEKIESLVSDTVKTYQEMDKCKKEYGAFEDTLKMWNDELKTLEKKQVETADRQSVIAQEIELLKSKIKKVEAKKAVVNEGLTEATTKHATAVKKLNKAQKQDRKNQKQGK